MIWIFLVSLKIHKMILLSKKTFKNNYILIKLFYKNTELKSIPFYHRLWHVLKKDYLIIRKIYIKKKRKMFVYLFVCFVLQRINLIGHLMPNQVKENKSEKKFKGEVLGINDKL